MGHGCVLVLDENRQRAQQLSTQLKLHRWASVLSFNPKTAMKTLATSRFHLVMFDTWVGNVDLLSKISDLRAAAINTPLALMTDSAAPKGRAAKAAGEGGDTPDFTILRPFTTDALKTLLAETVAYHRERATEQNVLIIENHAPLRRMLSHVLTSVGYKVFEADTMEDAFFDHNLGFIDVVVTAVLIPGIGGIEGIAQIKKDWPHIRTIAVSQGVDEKIVAAHVLAAARQAGADITMPKPYGMSEVLRAVASLITPKVKSPAATETMA